MKADLVVDQFLKAHQENGTLEVSTRTGISAYISGQLAESNVITYALLCLLMCLLRLWRGFLVQR